MLKSSPTAIKQSWTSDHFLKNPVSGFQTVLSIGGSHLNSTFGESNVTMSFRFSTSMSSAILCSLNLSSCRLNSYLSQFLVFMKDIYWAITGPATVEVTKIAV